MADSLEKGASKVKNWFSNVVDFAVDDSQSRLFDNNRPKDSTPNKIASDTSISSTTRQYGLAYSARETPAAVTVDSSWSKENPLEPNWPATSDNPNSKGTLPYSMFNRYALYNFRGFYGGFAPSLADYYTDENNESSLFRGKFLKATDSVQNVTEKKIIDFYSENFPRLAYAPTDFLYNRYFQEIPVNHLITLRRFAMPCEDNIFDLTNKYLSTCTATTYFGEKADNKLEDILKFSNVGLTWENKEAKMQEIAAGSSTSNPGAFDARNKNGSYKFSSVLAAKMAGKSAADLYRADKFGSGDPMQKYSSFVLGPVNVVDHTMIRNRGINFKNDFSLNFEYELKSWYMVNPKIAMLDLFSNMLVMTTNNGDFWGGGWRYNGGQSASRITDLYGNKALLRNGDFIGYMQSVVHDVVHGNENGVKGVTGLFGDGSGGFSFKSVLSGLGQVLQSLLTQKIGSFMDMFAGGLQNPGSNIPQALLSGEPTGYWHVVIGNPLNPIAIMGNMICQNNTFSLGGGLGYDDFPMEFKVTVSLEHGKPRDRSDIENMFNMGHGRIYAAPADDVTNIAGREVEEYGVYPTGPGMHTGIDKVASAVEMDKEHVSHIIALNIK